MPSSEFDYQEAFSRNIGWLTETEQAALRAKRVAVGGLGGVGGSHLLTLTRLGVGNFNISDLDTFELANFNRQAGASLSHVGRPKVDVLAEMALDINPELNLARFPEGIDKGNVDAFLEKVDLYVDGLDFFALEARRLVFAACAEKQIPAITAAPLGMGVALLAFLPEKMSFEEYFRLEGYPEHEQLLRFLLGLSPAMLQAGYLVDESRVDLAGHKGPSTTMACELCAGFAGTVALKVLLNRGRVPAAPWGLHFDAYRNRLKKTWRPRGNDNPIQRVAVEIAKRRLGQAPPAPMVDTAAQSPMERIIDLARWAPSGDNTQPYCLEILGEQHLLVRATDTRDHCVYDLDGRPTQLAIGALLQNLEIAASGEGWAAEWSLREQSREEEIQIDVRFSEANTDRHPLYEWIVARCTNRRPFSTRSLQQRHRDALEEAVGEGFQVRWLEGESQRRRMALLLFRSAYIRLTTPEAYVVHRDIIDWGRQFSRERVPDQAVGMDPVGLRLMKWALASWERVQWLNRYMAGTWLPRLQLDLVPGYFCAAHFFIEADAALESTGDWLRAGAAMQRFWLTATQLGLQLQPEMTPLIFGRYALEQRRFTVVEKAYERAQEIAQDLEDLGGSGMLSRAVFAGRVGFASFPKARSIRRQREQVMCSSGG